MDWSFIGVVMVALLSSGGCVTLLIDRFFLRKRNRVEIQKIVQDAQSVKLTNDEKVLENITLQTETIKKLVSDANEKTEAVRLLTQEKNTLQDNEVTMRRTIDGQNFVIGEHRKERTEWMEMLNKALTENTERRLKIEDMSRVQDQHAEQIAECGRREVLFFEVIEELEDRLTAFAGIMKDNNLEIPASFNGKPESVLKQLRRSASKKH